MHQSYIYLLEVAHVQKRCLIQEALSWCIHLEGTTSNFLKVDAHHLVLVQMGMHLEMEYTKPERSLCVLGNAVRELLLRSPSAGSL